MRCRLAWLLCFLAVLFPVAGVFGDDAGGATGGGQADGGGAAAANDHSAAGAGVRRYDFPLEGRSVVPTPSDSWNGVSDPLEISRAAVDPLGSAESLAWSAIWDHYYRDAHLRHERYEARHAGEHHGRIAGGFIPPHIEFGIVSADGFHRTGVVDASSNPGAATGLAAQPQRSAPLAPPASLSFSAATAPAAERPVVAALSQVPDVRPAAPVSAARPSVPPPPVARPPVSAGIVSPSGDSAQSLSIPPPPVPQPPVSAASPSGSSPREQALALLQKLLRERESAAGLRRGGSRDADAAAAAGPAPLLPPAERQRAMVARIAAKIAARTPISVTVQGDTATIRGSVASMHDRIVAEVMLRLEPGIMQVDNQLTVEP